MYLHTSLFSGASNMLRPNGRANFRTVERFWIRFQKKALVRAVLEAARVEAARVELARAARAIEHSEDED